ncbi:unnamed protein product, partial [Phaeothamnion confervicola]
ASHDNAPPGDAGVPPAWLPPSTGIALPPLQPREAAADAVGRLIVLKPARRNSMLSRLAGPTACCAWLVPGLVLMSGYPDGEAAAEPRRLRQPRDPDAAAQILLSGVGVLVACGDESEVREHERTKELRPFEAVFRARHVALRASLQAAAAAAVQTTALADQEVRALKSLAGEDSAAEERRQLNLADAAERATAARAESSRLIRTQERFPAALSVQWEAMRKDAAPPPSELVAVCRRLEERLRRGQRLLLWSPGGRGRCGVVAAALLGRLYGLAPQEALSRVQDCHDARQDV